MSFDFSIIIPSLGKLQFLQPLLESLQAQTFSGETEVLLCTTGVKGLLPLPQLKSNMHLQICDSPKPGISLARNAGLEVATGTTVMFIDEDCILPSSDYLENIRLFCKANPAKGGGGAYLTDNTEANFASAFYNYICNSWLESHVAPDNSASVLLGGCCFYPRDLLKNLRFPVSKPRAGEEVNFNADFLAHGYSLVYNPAWSVCHHPQYKIEDVFRRAWLHGLQLEKMTALPPPHRLAQFLARSRRSPARFIKFLPMTLAYSAWGRAAFASKFFRK